ncbi:MAG TPA: hypothetical protein VKY85_23025 [Candidatus Angelobacter sp.]|nr:hypothetical protein [Candidatus Angelobacter sp.]
MQADYSVELGEEDPALELPWRSDDSSNRYFNLKLHPDLVLNIPEARKHPELSAFLSRINVAGFPVETAKCDAWFGRELSPEEEIFGAACKFVCYVDLLFSDERQRFSLEKHERLAEDLCNLLKRAPEMAAAADFVVRHCHYHLGADENDSRIGFCITAYVTGYGDSQEEAHKRWMIALKLLQNALVQIAKHSR